MSCSTRLYRLLFFFAGSFLFQWCTGVQNYTIILDPGHGGPYTGTMDAAKKVTEKDIVLKIAKRLANRLQKRGYTVFLTRTTDSALDTKDLLRDLGQRAQLTRTKNADLFLSIHVNGCPNPEVQGYELYVPFEAQYPIRSYQFASTLHYDLSHKIKPQFSGGTLGNVNIVDRGIRASKFNVLMKASCPAALVELGYLTHQPSANQLCDSAYQELLVNALYCGIRRYMIHQYGF